MCALVGVLIKRLLISEFCK